MYVTLISYSQPNPRIAGLQEFDLKDLIAYKARVSNPANQMNTETAPGLLRYLQKHKHWSPFEMCHACLEIQTTRDIARQILRHRSFSFQEFSQRYAIPSMNDFRAREPRLQDTKNRQNSLPSYDTNLNHTWYEAQIEVWELARRNYEAALEMGIAKEQARALLPEGLTESTLFMGGTIRSWMHYIELRTGVETQKEHREVAMACAKALEPAIDTIMEATHHE